MVTTENGGWNAFAGPHWILKGQFCPDDGSERLKIHQDENGSYLDKLGQEEMFKDVLLKDIFSILS